MKLSYTQLIEVAKLAIGDERKTDQLLLFLPTIGCDVVDFIYQGEIKGPSYCTASFVITEELTPQKTEAIKNYISSVNI